MCVSPYIATRKDGTKVCVPCGKCIDCRKDYQTEWIFRLSQECKHVALPCFITLTYDDENLPLGDVGNNEPQSVLVKSDLQKFFKRLRRYGGDLMENMRYFAIGEYGSKFNRAHYHAVIMAPNLDRVSKLQKLVDKSWKFGFNKVKFCTDKQLHYVCKYMNKLDERPHLVKPFRLYSRSIGLNFLTDQMVNYYLTTFERTCVNGKCRISLPRYYRKKLDELSDSNWMLKKAGLKYTDLLEEVRVVEGTKYYYFKQFAENFDQHFAAAQRKIARLSRKLGYQYYVPSDQEVWQCYKKANKYLCDIVAESDRVLKGCQIRNQLLDLQPISYNIDFTILQE